MCIHQFCLTYDEALEKCDKKSSLGCLRSSPNAAYLKASEKGVRTPGRRTLFPRRILRTSRSDKGPESEESDTPSPQQPSTKPPRAILRPPSCCFSSRDVSSVLSHGKIIAFVSTCSSIRMEARTGAVDVCAEQRLEQQGHGSRTSG